MTVKIMNMMMKMVIILMLDHDNAQKSSTTMTFWSKYTSFEYYYLVKKDQTNRAGVGPPHAHLKTPFLYGCLPLAGPCSVSTQYTALQFFVFLLLTMILQSCLSDGDESCRKVKGRNLFCLKISGNV